jgi:hypothetical protein
MGHLQIHLRDDKTNFLPCETVEGTIQWNLDTNPRFLELSLFWYTAGKGTRDVGVVNSLKFDAPGAYGQKEFAFDLSDGPYSFSGKLISLIWAVELTCSPGGESVRQEFVLSPTGHEVLLDVHL